MSLEVSTLATACALVLGVALALGLVRSRGKVGSYAGFIMLIPLITPEIVTGVGSLTLFKGVGMALGFGTVTLAEVTFSISYVTVILRSRVAALNPETEEAALDLGATRWQALRLVTLPALLPAIISAGVLVFAMIFDDFVLAFFTTGVSPAAARGEHLLADPARRTADHQRCRHADAARLARPDRPGHRGPSAVRPHRRS